MRSKAIGLSVFGLAAGLALATPALAQKSGGILRVIHRESPASASIHEEATISTNMPYMAVFNNLVFFDPQVKINSTDHLTPELATEWAWSPDNTKLTFKLRDGVKWHDGKPFSSADVVCTFNQLIGKKDERVTDPMRKNPRKVWYSNLKDITADSPSQVTFHLERPQPSFLAFLSAGYTPIYPCHVPARVMRTAPIGTGPFKFAEYKRGELIRLVKNPDYWKKGFPYLDGITFGIIENRSTRLLSFATGQYDLTFDSDITIPMLKDLKDQAPNAQCEQRPTNVSSNLIINNATPPFDNPKIRQALLYTLDRQAFIDIISQGQEKIGASMLPGPEGIWAMPEAMLRELPGYGTDIAKNRAEGRKIMESLGYSAGKTLKVKVSTRNIAVYRDPAVILIDQLKHIYIEAELEPIDTAVWFSKVLKKDYSIGLNLTGLGVDDPDVNFYENYTCNSERNYTGYCNPEIEKLIDAQSREVDREKRKKLIWDVERKLIEDVARPIISHGTGNTCWQPQVKNLVLQHNTIYNGWRFEQVWLDK